MRNRPLRGRLSSDAPDPTTPNLQIRSLVVAHQDDAVALTGIGIPSTTPGSILASDDSEIAGYFDDGRPAVFVRLPDHDYSLAEAEAMAKLAELGVAVKVVRR